MAEWVLIENNSILEYHDLLPKNWKNHSGLNLSADNLEFLKTLGWYKVKKNSITYDPAFFRLKGYNYTIDNDEVTEQPILEQITEEEIIAQKSHDLNIFLNNLRTERNKRLLDSDISQLSDIREKQSEELKNSWILYRQLLRDLPSLHNEPGEITWPEKPNAIS